MPFNIIIEYLKKEEALGSPDATNVILATADKKGTPHSRVVAIREVAQDNILFFTQRNTRKVADLSQNPKASLTLWLPFQAREVIMDGYVESLNKEENEYYWKGLPRERQLRFSVYAQTCMEALTSREVLEMNYNKLSKKFEGQVIPMNENYCGFRLFAHTVYFYMVGNKNFSELIKYSFVDTAWQKQFLSP
jgi:pyridoxamine 5'-phosphate oxidase